MTALLDTMSERISILVKQDHLAQLANARTPLEAIAELVWNAFDADATTVTVSFTTNALEALDEIRVTDNGHGVFHPDAKQLFGNLGDSWKRAKRRTDGGRSIHGKQGKGRFKAFYLGSGASWNTTYRLEDGALFDYSITGDYATLNAFTVSTPTPAQGIATGTEVVIRNPHRNFRSLLEDEIRQLAAQHFGAYLTEYPSLSLIFNGVRIDPQVAQSRSTEVNLDLAMPDGQTIPAALRIIEWKHETDRLLHLCDGHGASCHSVVLGPGLKAKGFSFTAYLKTALVRELDRQHRLELDDLDENVKTLIHAGRETLRTYFKQRELEESSALVVRWQAEGIYPYADGQVGSMESAERQVFDILAANLSGYLKSFEGLDPAAKRFTFRLLAHALRENPVTIRSLITEGLNLTKEDQDNLASLFGKTNLAQLMVSAQIIRHRLGFLQDLERFVSAPEAKAPPSERDPLHGILEKEAWLFAEDFQVAAGEEWLETVLAKHWPILGNRADPAPTSDSADQGRRGRRDLMLSRTIQPHAGEYEHLVVELKRPSQPIDAAVVAQARQYATTVADDARFLGTNTRWRFWIVGNARTNEAAPPAEQDGPGIILQQGQVTVRAATWRELIDNARDRLGYCQQQLTLQTERDSTQSCLSRIHEKYLPTVLRSPGEAR